MKISRISIGLSVLMMACLGARTVKAGGWDIEQGGQRPFTAPSHLAKLPYLLGVLGALGGSAYFYYTFPKTSAIPSGKGRHTIAIGTYEHKWIAAEGGGGRELVGNRDVIGPWEKFIMNCSTEDCSTFFLQASPRRDWVAAEGGGGDILKANRRKPLEWETFTLKVLPNGKVAFQAHKGDYVTVEKGTRIIRADKKDIGTSEQFIIEELGN
jgi:hypothetical protein